MGYALPRFKWNDHALPGAALLAGVALAGANYAYPTNPAPPLASSAVKIDTAMGHGSGVYIGDGLLVTAAHVASEGKVQVKADDGTVREAEVLWSNTASDIALLRVSGDGLSASPLNCSAPVVGQSVHAAGNPMDIEFVTTYGHIISGDNPAEMWAHAVAVDMTILPGMSGGPTYNDAGEIVGISVGVMTFPMGLSASLTGIGIIVPAQEVCALMGRR